MSPPPVSVIHHFPRTEKATVGSRFNASWRTSTGVCTPAGRIFANMKLGAVAMTKHEIIALLKDQKQEMQYKFGATRIVLAGSYARTLPQRKAILI